MWCLLRQARFLYKFTVILSDQVCEYFQDFDPLRCGSITKSQFQRGLSDLGLSALGHHNLSAAQFEVLSQVYQTPNSPDKILWIVFMEDIESGNYQIYV
jgi:hypothetical protein